MKKLYAVNVTREAEITVMVVAEDKREAELEAADAWDAFCVDYDQSEWARECPTIDKIPRECLNDEVSGLERGDDRTAKQYITGQLLVAIDGEVPDTRQLHLMDRGDDPRPADETDALCAEYARLLAESHGYEDAEDVPTADLDRMVELSRHPLVQARLNEARDRDFKEASE